MEKNKKSPLDGFLEIVKEEQQKSRAKINKNLLEDILKTAAIFDQVQEDDDARKKLINALREKYKDTDLNQVSELFIYCQSQLSSNEEPVPTPSILCISIGKTFTNKNLHYIATKIYTGNQIESSCALIYLVYLAIYDENRAYVLDFIKDNFEGFSHNNKTECVFHLKDLHPNDEVAQQIVEESGIKEYRLIFSTESDSSSKPITFQINNDLDNLKEEIKNKETNFDENENKALILHKKWWQFWK